MITQSAVGCFAGREGWAEGGLVVVVVVRIIRDGTVSAVGKKSQAEFQISHRLE